MKGQSPALEARALLSIALVVVPTLCLLGCFLTVASLLTLEHPKAMCASWALPPLLACSVLCPRIAAVSSHCTCPGFVFFMRMSSELWARGPSPSSVRASTACQVWFQVLGPHCIGTSDITPGLRSDLTNWKPETWEPF